MYTIKERIVRSHSHLVKTFEIFYYFEYLVEMKTSLPVEKIYENDFLTLSIYQLLIINLSSLINKPNSKAEKYEKHSIDKLINCVNDKSMRLDIDSMRATWHSESFKYGQLINRIYTLRDEQFAHLDIPNFNSTDISLKDISGLLSLCEDILLKLDKLVVKSNYTKLVKEEFLREINPHF